MAWQIYEKIIKEEKKKINFLELRLKQFEEIDNKGYQGYKRRGFSKGRKRLKSDIGISKKNAKDEKNVKKDYIRLVNEFGLDKNSSERDMRSKGNNSGSRNVKYRFSRTARLAEDIMDDHLSRISKMHFSRGNQ